MHPNYEPQRWQQFLIYIGYNLAAFLINAFFTRLLPLITRSAFIWSILGFVVISITVLSCASPNYSSASFVFTDFINETGWPDGVAWLLGLLQAGLGLTGFDAVAHSKSRYINRRALNEIFQTNVHHSDRGNPERCCRRSQDHDLLRPDWHIYWLHLPHGIVVRGRPNRWTKWHH